MLGAGVLGNILPRCGRLKPRLSGSLVQAVSLKWSVKIADIEVSELRCAGWSPMHAFLILILHRLFT